MLPLFIINYYSIPNVHCCDILLYFVSQFLALKKLRHKDNKNNTEILYGIDSAVGRGIHLLQNNRQNAHIFGDKNSPSIII
jgi:hypothetical protein